MVFNPPPEPTYEYDVDKLVRYYRKAATEIVYLLTNFDLNALNASKRKKILQEIEAILKDVDINAEEWIKENIPKAYREGQAATLVTLGVAATIAEANDLISFSNLNRYAVNALIEDTFNDLLQATQNTRRKVKQTVREVFAEQMRSKSAQSLGSKAMKRDIIKDLREQLYDAGTFAIRDSANRKWSIEHYTNVVVRTKMQQAHVEGTTNQAIEREAFYGVISSHGAKDSCKYHEGRIVKLDPDAPGNYPTVKELKATGQIFHPNCKHTISAIRTPDVLPKSVREKAEKQAERGNKATATGKRNPTDVD